MKRIILVFIVAVLSVGFLINRIVERSAQQIISQLQINDETAKDYIWSNCSGNMFYFPSPGELKNIAMGERASIVKAIGNYAKEYTKTKEFLEKYKEFRESNKPEPPEAPQSGDQMKNEQKAAYKKSIAEMEKVKKTMAADQQAYIDQTIASLKEQLKALEDPSNDENYKQMDQIMKQGYEQQQVQHKEDLKEWAEQYPENPKVMIKAWLNSFLETTKDVDFNAELKNNDYGQKVFVKPEYESKSPVWKICFRSGKETLQAGRAFAEQWLKELK